MADLLGTHLVTQVDDILIVLLTAFIAAKRLSSASYTYRRTHIDLFAVLLTALFLLSGILNRVPLLNLLLSYKSYAIYVLYFICLLNLEWNYARLNRFVRLLLGVFVIQLPFVLSEIAYSFFRTGGFSDDTAGGTFGNANTLSYATLLPLVYVTYESIVHGKGKSLKYFVLLFPVLVLPMGEFAIAFYFLVLGVVLSKNILRSKRTASIAALLLLVLLILVGGFIAIKSRYSKIATFDTLNPIEQFINLTERQNSVYSGAQRNLYFPLTFAHLQSHSIHPALGIGPGMYASYTAFRLGPTTNDLVDNVFGQVELGMDPGVDSQIIPIWGELGYGGMLLFTLFLIGTARFFAGKLAEYRRSGRQRLESLAFTSLVGTVYIAVGFYVNHFWEIQPILMSILCFWALMFCYERVGLSCRNNSSDTTEVGMVGA